MKAPLIAGSSVVLRYEDNFVFELQKSHKWNIDEAGRYWIGLGCIGGSLEPGEEPLQALQREAREEIGCAIDIVPAKSTLVVNTDNTIGEPVIPGHCKDVAIQWYGDRPDYAELLILSYLGITKTPPAPIDLPGILLASPKNILETLRSSLTLAEMKECGIRIISRVQLPGHARLTPRGTAKRLFYLMEHEQEKLISLMPSDWVKFFI